VFEGGVQRRERESNLVPPLEKGGCPWWTGKSSKRPESLGQTAVTEKAMRIKKTFGGMRTVEASSKRVEKRRPSGANVLATESKSNRAMWFGKQQKGQTSASGTAGRNRETSNAGNKKRKHAAQIQVTKDTTGRGRV